MSTTDEVCMVVGFLSAAALIVLLPMLLVQRLTRLVRRCFAARYVTAVVRHAPALRRATRRVRLGRLWKHRRGVRVVRSR